MSRAERQRARSSRSRLRSLGRGPALIDILPPATVPGGFSCTPGGTPSTGATITCRDGSIAAGVPYTGFIYVHRPADATPAVTVFELSVSNNNGASWLQTTNFSGE